MAKETKTPGAPAVVPKQELTTFDYSSTGVTGFEATQQADLGIPFLSILQSGSPQIKKTDPNYALKKIEGAGEGDIINTLSNSVIYTQGRDPIKVIPCYHERRFVEWKPRNSGGGIVKMHTNAAIINECKRNEKNQDVLPNGNIIVTTAYFYVIVLGGDEPRPAIIGLSSTQLKKARGWLNMMMAIKLTGPGGQFTPPMFSHIYNISTVAESNQDGSWFGWKVELAGQLNDKTLIEKAIQMAKDSAAAARTVLPTDSADDHLA